MDQWMQKLSLIVVLLTAGTALYASKSGAICWCPAHFTSNHVHYADTICSHNRSARYEAVAGLTIEELGSRSERMTRDLLSENETILKYLAGELLLICALYSLIKCITSCSSFDVLFSYDLHKSYSKAPAYIIVQVAGCFMWLLFACLTYNTYTPEVLSEAEDPFICDFEIKRFDTIIRYTVQCLDSGESGMKTAVMINMGLCVVVGFSKLVHIVSVFGIQPLLKVDKVASKMVERNVIKEKSEIGLRFGLSDLYFAILVSGCDFSSQLSMKVVQDEKKEKIPIDGHPPSMLC